MQPLYWAREYLEENHPLILYLESIGAPEGENVDPEDEFREEEEEEFREEEEEPDEDWMVEANWLDKFVRVSMNWGSEYKHNSKQN